MKFLNKFYLQRLLEVQNTLNNKKKQEILNSKKSATSIIDKNDSTIISNKSLIEEFGFLQKQICNERWPCCVYDFTLKQTYLSFTQIKVLDINIDFSYADSIVGHDRI